MIKATSAQPSCQHRYYANNCSAEKLLQLPGLSCCVCPQGTQTKKKQRPFQTSRRADSLTFLQQSHWTDGGAQCQSFPSVQGPGLYLQYFLRNPSHKQPHSNSSRRSFFELAGIHQVTSLNRPKLTIPCPLCLPVTARDRTKIYMLVTLSSREDSMPVPDSVEGTLPS